MLPGQRKGVRVQRPGGIVLKGGQPDTQYSVQFLQGMVDRMLTSYRKYGHIKESIERGVDPLESSRQRIERYRETGNTEFLMDAANYIMMEFIHPSMENAHYDPESKSPGRILRTGRVSYKHAEDLE